ncbi:hypothetical protein ACFZAO_05285 [Streptomyces griseoaurantiacus]|uniref:hypothetical protein n=1 Tax=Streptomyces griseoaurantiacus TaxID=68213 RepID=UPI0036E3C162
MNAVQRFAYRRIPSFKRESGGLYNLYTSIYSRAYAARMRYLHQRGRHNRPTPHGLDPRCTWCGLR